MFGPIPDYPKVISSLKRKIEILIQRGVMTNDSDRLRLCKICSMMERVVDGCSELLNLEKRSELKRSLREIWINE